MTTNTTTTTRTLRVGVAGVGTGATGTILTFAKHPQVKLTAATDIDTDALARFQKDFQAETHGSIEELCKNPNVDAVYIATPNHLHAPMALTALEHGKHVYVEKSMAVTLKDAQAMAEMAERKGVNLVVTLPHSFDPPVRKMHEILRSGELGRLRTIHAWLYDDWLYRPRTESELDPSRGGGVTFRQGAHQFDLVRTLGEGLVRSVRATLGTWDEGRRIPGNHVVFMEFEDGTVATVVESGYDRFFTAELTFGARPGQPWTDASRYRQTWRDLRSAQNASEGELDLKKAARYGGARRRIEQVSGATAMRSTSFGYVSSWLLLVSCDKGDMRVTPQGVMVYGDEEQREISLVQEPSGDEVIVNDFYESAITGRKPLHDGRWGLATLEVTLAVVESSQQRKELLLSHQVSASR